MIALRVVLDTNVVISAVLKPEGLERSVVLLALAKPARWYVSEPIVKEYAAVLARPETQNQEGAAAAVPSIDQKSRQCSRSSAPAAAHTGRG